MFFFKKKPSTDTQELGTLIKTLLDALRDDQISDAEKEQLRTHAYSVLIKYDLDKIL